MNEIEKLGFKKNTKIISGYKPHYIKGNSVLFLIGADFWCHKIVMISTAFKDKSYSVFGIITEKAPRAADKDWVTGEPTLTLIQVNPLLKGQWNERGSDLEFIPIDISELTKEE